jgi:hypothetical protein
MSFDLIVWKEPAVSTEEEASSLVHRFHESGDPSVFHASEDLLHFYDELLQRCPALELFDDDERRLAETPWSVTPERSGRVIELNIRWRAPDDMVDTMVALARKHQLVMYDPQGPTLHSPVADDEPPDIAGQVKQALSAGAVGLVLIVAGSLIPFRVLGWPIIGIGAFLVLMTVYTLVVLWKPEWARSITTTDRP